MEIKRPAYRFGFRVERSGCGYQRRRAGQGAPRRTSSCSAAASVCAYVGLVLGLVASTGSLADEGRFSDYVIGGRALGFGGAFAALSDDASGVFYNPAGLADVPRANVNLSTTLYGIELNGTTPIESAVLRFESGLSAADLIILPSSAGGVTGLGDPLSGGGHRHAVAFATQVPQYSSRWVEGLETDPETGRTSRFLSSVTDRSLHAGAGYAFRAGPWARVGIAAHYILRTVDAQESVVSRTDVAESDFLVSDARLRSATHAVRAAIGMKLRPGPRLTLGACLTSPSLGFWRSVIFESAFARGTSDTQPAGLDLSRVDVADADGTSQLPAQLRVGVAWAEPEDFTVAADLIAYAPSRYEVIPKAVLATVSSNLQDVPIPLEIQRSAIANIALGVEKWVNDEARLAAGLFTNLTSAPPLAYDPQTGVLRPGSSRLSQVHMIGGTLALALVEANTVSRIGLTLAAGVGQVVLPTSPVERLRDTSVGALRVADASQTVVYLFWSSSFRWGDGRDARDLSL